MVDVTTDFGAPLNRRRTLLAFGGGLCLAALLPATPQAEPYSDLGPEPREFVVYFDPDNSIISQGGFGAVDEAVSYILERLRSKDEYSRKGRIVIVGFADSTELTTDKIELSKARALRVADKLVELGVPGNKIAVDWKGDTAKTEWPPYLSECRVTIDPAF